MTYLTQVWVERHEAVRHKLFDAYAWHQALWRALPHEDGRPRRFLFRVDDRHERFRLLLLSPSRPELQSWGQWATREIPPDFLSRDTYLFQVRANPTIKRVVRAPDGTRKRNGRREGITGESELLAWFDRKAEQSGFAVLECVVGPPTRIHFNKDRRRGTLVSVDFQGRLEVRDREAFEKAFHRGIGSAKAFGFGMLMLQPVK